MSVVPFSDSIALVCLVAALVVLLMTPACARSVGATFKYSLAGALALLVFVSLSNVLEHAGITTALDAYEDYAEVLFVPLVAYILLGRSMTEQLEAAEAAEEQTRREHALLMSVVDTAPSSILVADSEGNVWFANDEARRYVEQPGDGASMVLVPGLRPVIARAVEAAPVRIVRRWAMLDGAERWFSISATRLTSSSDGGDHAVVAFQDVTERVAAEAELEEYREALEEQVDRRTSELLELNRQLTDANKTGQRLLANVSHEFRTPLNSIIGFTDLLLGETSGPLNAEQRRQLGFVNASGNQLLTIVESVLELARVEAGRGAVSLSVTELGHTVRDVVNPIGIIAEDRGITLTCVCEAAVTVWADVDKLGQIVRNLVTNAVKFTDPGGVVEVRLVVEVEEVLIQVADNGIGIAPEDQKRIFEAFEQVDRADRARVSGAGLGLSICRDLCGLLGYGLSLESEPGMGSTFTVHIPFEPDMAPTLVGETE